MKFINFEERTTGKLLCIEVEAITIILQATERDLHLEDFGVKESKDYLEQFDNTTEFTIITTTAGTIHVRENIHQVLSIIINALDYKFRQVNECPRCKNTEIEIKDSYCKICGFKLKELDKLKTNK